MGISCDFEDGSMESEIKPTCNKEFVKLNGQHSDNTFDGTAADENDAAVAITKTTSDVITIDDPKLPDSATNIASPISSQEPETIVIVDDAEPEEGEIINSDDEFQYEAISSDEEFSLRQKIEALEAKNREFEKIASISASHDYGYRRSPNYINYKSPTSNRSNNTKTIPPLSSFANYKPFSLSHVENISSDEAQIIDSDEDFSSIFDSGKQYSRTHRATKKDKRQTRRKTRPTNDNDKERCQAHGKRRCPDVNCYSIEVTAARKKRVRHKHEERKTSKDRKYSSDSENELLGKREELKMALNIIAPSNKTINTSTLSHKLSAIQALEDGKKMMTKRKKRKSSKSPERQLAVRRRTRSKENTSKRIKIDHGRRSRNKTESPIAIVDNIENDVHEDEDEAMSLEEQELRLIALKSAVLKKHEARKRKQQTSQMAIQLVEQIVRPYSPTDSVVLVADETGDKSNDCIDSDNNNNMDISPLMSPSSPGNSYQPMDMDLASSNENSKSPVFSYEKPQTFAPYEQFIDWRTVTIPMPISAPFIEMDQTAVALNQTYAMQPPFSLIFDQMHKDTMTIENSIAKPIQMESKEESVVNASVVNASVVNASVDNEEELRAQLIQQLRNTAYSMNSNNAAANSSKAIDASDKAVPKEHFTNINVDDTTEEDCLRSLLLSSKGKKTNAIKDSTNELPTTLEPVSTSVSTVAAAAAALQSQKLDESQKLPDQAKCDDLPKLTLNLREALKRIKDNQQNKAATKAVTQNATVTPATVTQTAIDNCEPYKDLNSAPHEIKRINSETLNVCDPNEIQKTVDDNNCCDKTENDRCISEVTTTKLVVPSKQQQSGENAPANVIAAAVPVVTANKARLLPLPKQTNVDDVKKPTTKVIKNTSAGKIASVKQLKSAASVKTDSDTQVSKPIAVSKPKPKIASKTKPVAVSLPKPPSSTSPAVNKTSTSAILATSTSTVTALASSTSSPSIISNLSKIETTRKSNGSPIITTWTPKPVKKLIISLNADSSSENDEIDVYTKYKQSSIKKADTDSSSQSNDSSNTFQLRLDQFLQSVRANTETVQEPKPNVPTPTKKPKTQENHTNNSTQKTSTIPSKTESSKAVAHLPMSSQLEYHRLLNRMKLLEKQKEHRLKNDKVPTTTTPVVKTIPVKKDANFSSLTVIVQNENRIIQTVGKASDVETGADLATLDGNKVLNINKPTSKTPTPTANTSLAKRVLVKNAMDSLNDATQAPVANTDAPEAKPTPTISTSVDDAQLSQSTPENNATEESKQGPLSLEMFAKKTAKVKASVLANYVKRYRSQGEQYLNGLTKLHRLTCRTTVESKKRQKLEQVLDELKRQTAIVQEKLVQQNSLITRLHPAISATEKAITADRTMLVKLANCCNRLGNIAEGPDFKIKCDKDTEIKEKLKQISVEKNRLKLLGHKFGTPSTANKPIVKQPQPPNTAIKFNDSKQIVPKVKADDANDTNAKPLDEKLNGIKQTKATPPIQMEIVVAKKTEADVKQDSTKPLTSDSGQNAIKSLDNISERTEIRSEKVEDSSQQPVETSSNVMMQVEKDDKCNEEPNPPDNLTGHHTTTMGNHQTKDSETVCGKYDSPLEHMQNCVDLEPQPSVSVADRNAIVCPYDLMGRCEDKQCEYKHLSM